MPRPFPADARGRIVQHLKRRPPHKGTPHINSKALLVNEPHGRQQPEMAAPPVRRDPVPALLFHDGVPSDEPALPFEMPDVLHVVTPGWHDGLGKGVHIQAHPKNDFGELGGIALPVRQGPRRRVQT